MLSVEPNEASPGEGALGLEPGPPLDEDDHLLGPAGADRLYERTSQRELTRQRLGHGREGGADDDRVERRLRGEAEGAVADDEAHVGEAPPGQGLASRASTILATSEGCVVTWRWLISTGTSR